MTVEARLTNKEMYNFLLRHNYFSLGGICGVILSIGAIVLAVLNINNTQMNGTYKIALVFVGLLFTVIQPVMLYTKASSQVKKNDSVNKPLKYTFTDKDFSISVDEDSVTQSYEDIIKVISTKLSVIIYINKYRAFILPKSAIGENMEQLKALLEKNAKNAKVINVK